MREYASASPGRRTAGTSLLPRSRLGVEAAATRLVGIAGEASRLGHDYGRVSPHRTGEPVRAHAPHPLTALPRAPARGQGAPGGIASSLTGPPSAGDSGGVIQCTRNKKVDKETLDRLGHAQSAINYAQQQIPYGPGNQNDAIRDSNGESAARVSVARNIPITGGSEHGLALSRACNAISAGGGNCDEYGALTYAHLSRQSELGNVKDPVFSVALPNVHHAFSLIGDRRMMSDDKVAMVDAWPMHAQAHTLGDMKTNWQGDLGNLQTLSAFHGGYSGFDPSTLGPPVLGGGSTDAMTHLGINDHAGYTNNVLGSPHIWNQQYSTEHDEPYSYSESLSSLGYRHGSNLLAQGSQYGSSLLNHGSQFGSGLLNRGSGLFSSLRSGRDSIVRLWSANNRPDDRDDPDSIV